MTNTMKRLLASAAFAALVLACAPAAAWAATDEPEVVLQGQDAGVAVALQLPAGPADDTRALQLSLRVAVQGGSLKDVGFDFDAALGANVKEARYHADQNLLTLYLAGGQNLFANPTLNLGSVVPVDPGADGVRLAVSAVPSSLTVVNGAHSESAPSFYASPDPTIATVGGTGQSMDPGNPGATTQPGAGPATGDPAADDGANGSPLPLPEGAAGTLSRTGDGQIASALALVGCLAIAAAGALLARKRRRMSRP